MTDNNSNYNHADHVNCWAAPCETCRIQEEAERLERSYDDRSDHVGCDLDPCRQCVDGTLRCAISLVGPVIFSDYVVAGILPACVQDALHAVDADHDTKGDKMFGRTAADELDDRHADEINAERHRRIAIGFVTRLHAASMLSHEHAELLNTARWDLE